MWRGMAGPHSIVYAHVVYTKCKNYAKTRPPTNYDDKICQHRPKIINPKNNKLYPKQTFKIEHLPTQHIFTCPYQH